MHRNAYAMEMYRWVCFEAREIFRDLKEADKRENFPNRPWFYMHMAVSSQMGGILANGLLHYAQGCDRFSEIASVMMQGQPKDWDADFHDRYTDHAEDFGKGGRDIARARKGSTLRLGTITQIGAIHDLWRSIALKRYPHYQLADILSERLMTGFDLCAEELRSNGSGLPPTGDVIIQNPFYEKEAGEFRTFAGWLENFGAQYTRAGLAARFLNQDAAAIPLLRCVAHAAHDLRMNVEISIANGDILETYAEIGWATQHSGISRTTNSKTRRDLPANAVLHRYATEWAQAYLDEPGVIGLDYKAIHILMDGIGRRFPMAPKQAARLDACIRKYMPA